MLWHFLTRNGVSTFGPYSTFEEAAQAFQRIHGYWPGEPLNLVVETTTYRAEDFINAA